MPLTTMVTGTPAKASDANANWSLCVLTDTAKTISVTHVWAATQQFTTLTASRPVYTDASQNLVSATVTGTGSVVQSVSPTITGTLVLAAATASGLISGSAGLTISAGTSALQAITGTTLVLSSSMSATIGAFSGLVSLNAGSGIRAIAANNGAIMSFYDNVGGGIGTEVSRQRATAGVMGYTLQAAGQSHAFLASDGNPILTLNDTSKAAVFAGAVSGITGFTMPINSRMSVGNPALNAAYAHYVYTNALTGLAQWERNGGTAATNGTLSLDFSNGLVGSTAADAIFSGPVNGGIRFQTNGAAIALDLSKLGNVIIGSAALATTATDGFLYIPTCAGAPTGAPTAVASRIPMIYDSTNNFFYFYNGAWKKSTVYA